MQDVISFTYDGIPFSQLDIARSQRQEGLKTTVEYTVGTLRATCICTEYPQFHAKEWVTWYENTGEENTGIVREIRDCDIPLSLPQTQRPSSRACLPEEGIRVYHPTGSLEIQEEFYCKKPDFLFEGDERTYATSGGRSSQAQAPFFDVNAGQEGVLLAIGWSGQWECTFLGTAQGVRCKAGLPCASFYLKPGEKVRTASILLLRYHEGPTAGHNALRRLIKERFSLVGSAGRDAQGPLCASFWGGMSSEQMCRRLRHIGENDLGFDYLWIDAGWYGDSPHVCLNEFDSHWQQYTGDWRVNPYHHPDGLREVSALIRENGMGFLLWMEPERVRATAPIVREHPEYFVSNEKNPGHLLLNLGKPAAWDYLFQTISGFVEDLHLGFFRQDFNFDPLDYWLKADEPNRSGLTEIFYIMGLYRLWDSLLERFPHLMIDNCASGGRRIDIETLRRSVPLWRSDYQCPANFDPETSQMHTMSFNWWIPYSSAGMGRIANDTYRMRSCYGTGLSCAYWFSAEDQDELDGETLSWIRRMNREYKRARPYFSCDFYPLTQQSFDDGSWCAWQFDRPEGSDGILMVFKRPNSTGVTSRFTLGGVDPGAQYRFENADTGEETIVSGAQLAQKGWWETIEDTRVSRLYFYSRVR